MTFVHSPRFSSVLKFASVLFLVLTSFAISVPAHAFSEVHTVTFFENVNASDSVTAIETSNSPQSLTLIQNLSPSFSDPGYTFVGWNTSESDGGTPLANGSTYSFSADVGLYAQWVPIPIVHNVTFFENANATDSATAMEAASAGQDLTLFQNLTPSFSNIGHAFVGWNTSVNGSGTSYADGSTYTFNTDVALYAQWSEVNVRTVTLYENDNASDSTDSTISGNATASITLFASLQPVFSNVGYSFTDWNTSANGSGTSYSDGAQYSFISNMALYAQWSVNAAVHTVTFTENDSASDSVKTAMSQTVISPLTLFANLQPAFVNGSEVFSGWNTARDGTGMSYSDGDQFSFQSDLVLYAQWTSAGVETYSFNANGGSGTINSISGLHGSNFVVPGQTGLIRAGFVLTDWNTIANGSGTKYSVGERVTIASSTLLFAQWSGHKPATLFGAIGTFKSGSSSLSPSLKSQINRVALTIRVRKYLKIDLFGYTATTGLGSLNISLSRNRARNVANYLRNRLDALKVRGVHISSSGQGSIASQSNKAYSRVEVFGV